MLTLTSRGMKRLWVTRHRMTFWFLIHVIKCANLKETTDNLGAIGVEEHTISTARSAMIYLDSGYTM